MSDLQIIFSILFVTIGILFMLVGSVGILRLPDFYSRTHAVSKSDTLGVIFVIAGLVIYEGLTLSSVKLTFVILFIALSNPVGSHALARAAFRKGIKPFYSTKKKGGDAS
ncbi:MAG: monovalent cation/H(+) antiporter subunit G [Balneolaceae bacterium]